MNFFMLYTALLVARLFSELVLLLFMNFCTALTTFFILYFIFFVLNKSLKTNT